MADQHPPSPYEGERAFDLYMLLHYGSAEDNMPHAFGPPGTVDYPARVARVLASVAERLGAPMGRALELGCSVGGTSFELARHYAAVVGVDASHRSIAAAEALRQAGCLGYFRKDDGLLGEHLLARVDPAIARERVRFVCADARALPPLPGGFDAVVMANLLCRLADPLGCLEHVSRHLLAPGGLLLLVSPYAWMEQFTPVERWPGGVRRGDRPVRSEEALKAWLARDFELVDEGELPLTIRESARNFQFLVAHVLLGRKRPA